MKRILIIPLVLFLFSLIPSPAIAQLAEGTIQGQLINNTPGGASIAGQTVSLYFLDDITGSTPLSTQTDQEGRFSFTSISTGVNSYYGLMVDYQESPYYSELITFEEGESTKEIQISVWDSTENRDAITFDTAHIVIDDQDGYFNVTEMYSITNLSDVTYIGTAGNNLAHGRTTLNFSLPADAVDLQFSEDIDTSGIYASSAGFFDTNPIYPGNKQMIFTYSVPAVPNVEVSRTIEFPTSNLDFLVNGVTIGKISDNLIKSDPIDMGDVVYDKVTGSNLTTGDMVSVKLAEKSKFGLNILVISAASVAAIALLAFAYIFFKSRARNKLVSVQLADESSTDVDLLITEINQLDSDFENGLILENEYHQLRNSKKTRLSELMKKSQTKE